MNWSIWNTFSIFSKILTKTCRTAEPPPPPFVEFSTKSTHLIFETFPKSFLKRSTVSSLMFGHLVSQCGRYTGRSYIQIQKVRPLLQLRGQTLWWKEKIWATKIPEEWKSYGRAFQLYWRKSTTASIRLWWHHFEMLENKSWWKTNFQISARTSHRRWHYLCRYPTVSI